VLLRLARGSGVAGLAGMAAVSTREGLALHRPLLDWSKADLAAVCAAESQDTLDDPSNRDPAFARSRWRALAPELAREGSTRRRSAGWRDGRRGPTRRWSAPSTQRRKTSTRRRTDGRIRLEAAALAELPEEIALRLLGRLLRQAAGRETTLRLDRLESLAQRLRAAADAGAALTATLGGALARLDRRGRLTLGAEPPRRRWAGAGKSSR
jgi:tRNA(Ile)-lysidine synthase